MVSYKMAFLILCDHTWFCMVYWKKKKKSTHTILEQELKWGKEKSTFFFLIKNNSMKVG